MSLCSSLLLIQFKLMQSMVEIKIHEGFRISPNEDASKKVVCSKQQRWSRAKLKPKCYPLWMSISITLTMMTHTHTGVKLSKFSEKRCLFQFVFQERFKFCVLLSCIHHSMSSLLRKLIIDFDKSLQNDHGEGKPYQHRNRSQLSDNTSSYKRLLCSNPSF